MKAHHFRRFIQRYNMKQHIKTHRMDPEDVKIHMDLTPKVLKIILLMLLYLLSLSITSCESIP